MTAIAGLAVALVACLQLLRLARVLDRTRRRAAARRRFDSEGLDDLFANPLTPGLSVIVTTPHLRPSTTRQLRTLLALRYPQLEVVAAVGRRSPADLERVAELGASPTPGGRRHEIHRDAGAGLTVILPREERRDDPAIIDVALATARHPLVCFLGEGWCPEDDALLRLARPFVDADDTTAVTTATLLSASRRGIDEARQQIALMSAARLPWATAAGHLSGPATVGLFRRRDALRLPGGHADLAGLAADVCHDRAQAGLGSTTVAVPSAIIRDHTRSGHRLTRQLSPRRAAGALVELAGWAAVLVTTLLGASPAWLALYALVAVGLGTAVSAAALVAVSWTPVTGPTDQPSEPATLAAIAAAVTDNLGGRARAALPISRLRSAPPTGRIGAALPSGAGPTPGLQPATAGAKR